VRCLGAERRERVLELLQSADVFVMPSVISPDGRRDGIPVALMEAMATCLPVVATRVSGVPELVEEGVTGWLVEPSDVGALADAIEEIARDPVAARELGRRARARVQADFDVTRNAQRMFRIVTGASAGEGAEEANAVGDGIPADRDTPRTGSSTRIGTPIGKLATRGHALGGR
jgi:glycosyltransferase involved in cell wall biosynthesis